MMRIQFPTCLSFKEKQANNNDKRLKRNIIFIILIFVCTMVSTLSIHAISDSNIIYVAGNPNLYPIEYYDVEEKAFKGVIPTLLQEFSLTGPYRIEYLDSGNADVRHTKYNNNQAELISGCILEDNFSDEAWQNGLTVIQASHDGQIYDYRILFNEIADETLKQDLTFFLSGVTENKRNDLMIQASQNQNGFSLFQLLSFGGAIALLFLLIIVILVYRFRKKFLQAQLRLGTDHVTGIGNYDYLTQYYKQIINDKNRVLYNAVYFYTNTSRLRRLGGNKETDEFLRYMAIILNQYTADTDILARVADGGFVLMKLSTSETEIQHWILPVFQRMKEYSKQYEKPYPIEVFAGVYSLKQSDRDLDTIIFNAEQSSYYARDNQLEYAECTKEIMRTYEDEHGLLERIDDAVKQKEFSLFLHFFVNPKTSEIVGAEALSRWNHPNKGLLNPGKYVPLMEREKKIYKLDYYMLEQVCMFLEELYLQHTDSFFISCNFSRDTFAASDFVENCINIIQKYQFPREELILELTENGSVHDTDIIYQNAVRMKEFGTSIALDDFGNGCSDLFDLEKYHFDALKLDKGLIDNLETNEGEIILDGIIQIGHRLGMTILAEGAESKEEIYKLLQLNCDVIQGFYYYQPLPAQEAKRIYSEQSIHETQYIKK